MPGLDPNERPCQDHGAPSSAIGARKILLPKAGLNRFDRRKDKNSKTRGESKGVP